MGRKKSNKVQEHEFHLRDTLDKYLVHWKWFLIGIGSCLFFAFLYLKYSTPQYQATTTILVKDEKKGSMLSELSAFSDLGLAAGFKGNVDNEIEILKSRTLVESTVRKLNLNVTLYIKGSLIDSEIYGNSPIEVNFINRTPKFYSSDMVFNCINFSDDSFEIENETSDSELKSVLNSKKKFKFGEVVRTVYGDLIINKSGQNESVFKNSNISITITVSPLEEVVESFQKRLNVTSMSKTTSVVSLSITDPIIKKAEDFLDQLVQIYNENAAADKNFISETTSKFIANRLT